MHEAWNFFSKINQEAVHCVMIHHVHTAILICTTHAPSITCIICIQNLVGSLSHRMVNKTLDKSEVTL